LTDRNRKANILRNKRISAGLCPSCGRKSAPGVRSCKRHVEYFRRWSRRAYAKALGRAVPEQADGRVKHASGLIKTPVARAYSSAKNRCNNTRNKNYYCYGGRGIKFLFTSLEQWVSELGPRPTPKHSVDRRNNNGNYAPGNVRWATKKQQRKNKRHYAAIETFSNETLLAECKRRRLCLKIKR